MSGVVIIGDEALLPNRKAKNLLPPCLRGREVPEKMVSQRLPRSILLLIKD